MTWPDIVPPCVGRVQEARRSYPRSSCCGGWMPEGPIRLWSVKYRELLLDIPRPLDQRNVIAFSSDVTELVALDLRDGRAGDQIKLSDDAFYCVRLDERIGDFASTSHQAPNEVC